MDLILLKSFIPEIFLSTCILFQILNNSFLITSSFLNFPIFFKELTWQYFFILGCLLLLTLNNLLESSFSNLLFINDLSTTTTKTIILLSCIFSFFAICTGFKNQYLNFFEFFLLFFFAILASLLLVSATDLLSIYLLIELQALAFYCLASFKRSSAFSVEAGLKYFISGSFFSSIFLLGVSLLYGFLGTANLLNLKLFFLAPSESLPFSYQLGILVGTLLVTVVFLFKLGVSPFHFWVPDVYEGSPLSTTVIFSIVPKLSMLYVFLKWLLCLNETDYTYALFVGCGLLSILWCSFFALQQKRLKRFLIYSSIAQTGFIIIACTHLTPLTVANIYFFISLYLLTSILLWVNTTLFSSFLNAPNFFYRVNTTKITFLSFFKGFFKTNPIWSFSNVLIFFSLAGVPPLVGFLAKILIMYSLLQSSNSSLFLITILISSISTFYYLKVLKLIFFNNINITSKINIEYLIYNQETFYLNTLIISFLMFLLLGLFFSPSSLLLLTHFITASFFFI